MELIDIVDENNELTGDTVDRKEVHKKGLWHREVAILILNEKNEFLIQKRASTKKLAPNMWSLTAGHIESGETIEKAVLRETEEELGIKNLNIKNFKFICVEKCNSTSGNIINNHFKYIYLLKVNFKINDYIIQKSELSEVKYISFEMLEEIYNNKEKYCNEYTKIFFKKYFNKIINTLK